MVRMKTTTASRSLRAAVAALIVAVGLAACAPAEPAGPAEPVAFDGSHVGVAAWQASAAQGGVVILDVRSPAEFAGGHIEGALNIDVNGADFAAQVAALDPSVDYAVYCRSGNRSRTAIDIMAQAGVTQTLGLEGGIGAWTGAGNPTV